MLSTWLPAISLLGETPGPNPDPRAAVQVITVLNKIFDLSIDTEKLLGQADQIEHELSKLAEQVKTTEPHNCPGKNSQCTGDFNATYLTERNISSCPERSWTWKIKTIEIRSPHNFLSVLETNVGDIIFITATSREDVRQGTMGLIARIREKQVSMHKVIQKTLSFMKNRSSSLLASNWKWRDMHVFAAQNAVSLGKQL